MYSQNSLLTLNFSFHSGKRLEENNEQTQQSCQVVMTLQTRL